MNEVPASYYGSTLTTICGNPRPDKSLVQSLECTRLDPMKSRYLLPIRKTLLGASSISKDGLKATTGDPLNGANSVTTNKSCGKSFDAAILNGHVNCEQPQKYYKRECSSAVNTDSSSNGFRSRYSWRRADRSCTSVSLTVAQRPLLSGRTCSSSGSKLSTHTSISSRSKSSFVQGLNLASIGLFLWCLEHKKLKEVAKEDYSFFHQGSVYIVFQRKEEGETYLHVWHGSQSSQNDAILMRSIVCEIDRAINTATFLCLEWEGSETATFHSHFTNGIVIVEGKSIATSASAFKYTNQLYHIKGRQFPSATCMECSALAVNNDNLIMLDSYPRMYVCIGNNVDYVLRQKALRLAQMVNVQQRAERCQIIVMDENEEHLKEKFMKKLKANLSCDKLSSEEIFDEVRPQETLQLFKINGCRIEYDFPLVSNYPLQQKYLTCQALFLLKVKKTQPVYIWVGSHANSAEVNEALFYGQIFMQANNFPPTTPLCRIRENSEPKDFKKYFKDWKEKMHNNQVMHSYTVANIERLLLSNFAVSVSGKLKESEKTLNFFDCDMEYKVWLIDESLISVKSSRYLAFERNNCYLIVCHPRNGESKSRLIYYWLGKNAPDEKKKLAQSLALQCKSFLKGNYVLIRVLEGKEPKHFLKVVNNCLIVYDADPLLQDLTVSDVNFNLANEKVVMFCVRELYVDAVIVSQVQTQSQFLNSSAVFIIISNTKNYLWYGKNSSALEREIAKHLIGYFCPKRVHGYSIVTEGKESNFFWSYILKDEGYLEKFPKKTLCPGQPRLIMCSQKQEKWFFQDIEQFSNENLKRNSMCILDTRDCILLWTVQTVNEETNEAIVSLIDAYLAVDFGKRQESDLEIWILDHSDEPDFLSNFFGTNFFKSSSLYSQERKKIHIANSVAKILSTDPGDMEFPNFLIMSKGEFYSLPLWKQHQIFKSTRLLSL